MDTPIFNNMRNYYAFFTGVLCFLSLVFHVSCGSLPSQKPDEKTPAVSGKGVTERPRPPEEIMGRGMAAKEKMALFLLSNNSKIDASFARSLAGFYIEEAAAEGVNHDVAFAQMCLETGSLRYGGLVTPDMNNFCGLGSTGAPGPDGPERGAVFPDPRSGVRAHIQHLKAYASKEPPNRELVDPRYHYVRPGIAPTIHGLAGKWAMDVNYGRKIAAILKEMYEFSF